MDRVQVLKVESTALGGDSADEKEWGPTPIEPQEDAIEVAGLFLQDISNRDNNVLIDRASGMARFKDTVVTTPRPFSDLTWSVDFLIDNDPVAVGIGYVPTYVSNKVTLEEWTRTVGSTLIKSIAYTYVSNRLSTEVRKVFAADGTTILGQVTITYSYTGNNLTSATTVRDV